MLSGNFSIIKKEKKGFCLEVCALFVVFGWFFCHF